MYFSFLDYEYKTSYWSDLIIETDDGKYMCPDCKRCYKYKTSAYTHMKNDCGKQHSYKCEICKFSCKYLHILQRHQRSITHNLKIEKYKSCFNK